MPRRQFQLRRLGGEIDGWLKNSGRRGQRPFDPANATSARHALYRQCHMQILVHGRPSLITLITM